MGERATLLRLVCDANRMALRPGGVFTREWFRDAERFVSEET